VRNEGIKGFTAELVYTKPGKKDSIPVNNKVVEMIEEIGNEKGIDLYKLNEEDRNKYIFTDGKRERLKSFPKSLHKTFIGAGISYRKFHTFRHFWTKMMFNSGVDPFTIMKIGRWKSLKTMLKYCYTSTTEEYEAVNKLYDNICWKNSKNNRYAAI
jgi:integrase